MKGVEIGIKADAAQLSRLAPRWPERPIFGSSWSGS
jgi:hypothetical protein